jgi:hypothetical protein
MISSRLSDATGVPGTSCPFTGAAIADTVEEPSKDRQSMTVNDGRNFTPNFFVFIGALSSSTMGTTRPRSLRVN